MPHPEPLERGIRIGMPLREVNAVCAQAVFIPANPVRDALAFEQILAQLETVSPALEPVEPGRCYVDMTGLDRHYPSPEAIAEALLASRLADLATTRRSGADPLHELGRGANGQSGHGPDHSR